MTMPMASCWKVISRAAPLSGSTAGAGGITGTRTIVTARARMIRTRIGTRRPPNTGTTANIMPMRMKGQKKSPIQAAI